MHARVNNLGMCITQDLNSALRHLRHRTGVRKMWINVFCINRRNLSERRAQTDIMKTFTRWYRM